MWHGRSVITGIYYEKVDERLRLSLEGTVLHVFGNLSFVATYLGTAGM